jgi:hypothetical protein
MKKGIARGGRGRRRGRGRSPGRSLREGADYPAARVDMHVRQRTYDLRREVAWVRGVQHPDRHPRLELPFGPRETSTTGFITSTTVFRGMHQLGEPQPGREITSRTVTMTCQDPP